LSSLHHTPPPQISTLSLHDALPISTPPAGSSAPRTPPRWSSGSGSVTIATCSSTTSLPPNGSCPAAAPCASTASSPKCGPGTSRSEEHTSELQSQSNLVCRLLLEKK